jgi:hypothetical protein
MKILNTRFYSIVLFWSMVLPALEFPFGVSFLKKGPKTDALYGTAHSNYALQGKIKDSALFRFDGITVQPLTPEKVTINITNESQLNPLYDQGIRALGFIAPEQKDLPIVLSTADLKRVYAFENVDTGSLLVSEILKDSQGNDTSLIQGLSASIEGTVFTVTYPNQGQLGDAGTGIAAITRGYLDVNKQSQRIFTQIALNAAVNTATSSYPFDLSSPMFVLIIEWLNHLKILFYAGMILCSVFMLELLQQDH